VGAGPLTGGMAPVRPRPLERHLRSRPVNEVIFRKVSEGMELDTT